VTVGCSHNKCTYCAMYSDGDQKFKVKPWETVKADIDEIANSGYQPKRMFLCDGDALILSTDKLCKILEEIRTSIPSVRRVGVYGDARSVLKKSASELKQLKDLGLGIVYHGVESGSNQVLKNICKGSTAEQAIETAHRLKEAGIRHSVIVMLGVAGTELSELHATETAKILTAMNPPFVGALTTTVIPETPMGIAQQAGEFALPDPWGMLDELRTIIEQAELTRCAFHSNHASNYLPLRLNLPTDRDKGLKLIDEIMRDRDPSMLKDERLRGL
ncbi:radical SAM protein, partial [bacterium]|nr:radical SAM protein [bacterium]